MFKMFENLWKRPLQAGLPLTASMRAQPSLDITPEVLTTLFLKAFEEIVGSVIKAEDVTLRPTTSDSVRASWNADGIKCDLDNHEVVRIIDEYLQRKIDPSGISIDFHNATEYIGYRNEWKLGKATITPENVATHKFALELQKLIS